MLARRLSLYLFPLARGSADGCRMQTRPSSRTPPQMGQDSASDDRYSSVLRPSRDERLLWTRIAALRTPEQRAGLRGNARVDRCCMSTTAHQDRSRRVGWVCGKARCRCTFSGRILPRQVAFACGNACVQWNQEVFELFFLASALVPFLSAGDRRRTNPSESFGCGGPEGRVRRRREDR